MRIEDLQALVNLNGSNQVTLTKELADYYTATESDAAMDTLAIQWSEEASPLGGKGAIEYVDVVGPNLTATLSGSDTVTITGKMVLANVTSDPSSPANGEMWLRTDL